MLYRSGTQTDGYGGGDDGESGSVIRREWEQNFRSPDKKKEKKKGKRKKTAENVSLVLGYFLSSLNEI